MLTSSLEGPGEAGTEYLFRISVVDVDRDIELRLDYPPGKTFTQAPLEVEVILPDHTRLETESSIVVTERCQSGDCELFAQIDPVSATSRCHGSFVQAGLERQVGLPFDKRGQLDPVTKDSYRVIDFDEGVNHVEPSTLEETEHVPVPNSGIEPHFFASERDCVGESYIVVDLIVEAGPGEIVVQSGTPPDVGVKAGFVGKEDVGLEHGLVVEDRSVVESDVLIYEVG